MSCLPDIIVKEESMAPYQGRERRKFPRIEKNFVVSYRLYGDAEMEETSHSKNFGGGGMFLTMNRAFDNGTILAIEIRLPLIPIPIRLLGKILESKEIAKNLIYETRLSFTYMDDQSKIFVKDTVNHFLKEDAK